LQVGLTGKAAGSRGEFIESGRVDQMYGKPERYSESNCADGYGYLQPMGPPFAR
jgi:hypothetical protein